MNEGRLLLYVVCNFMYKVCSDEAADDGRYYYNINESVFLLESNIDVLMMSPPHTPPRRRNYQELLKVQGRCLTIHIQHIFMWILQE